LKEEKATLEGMVQPRDELLMEVADEFRLNRMGEDNEEDDIDDEDDDDDTGDTAAPPVVAPPPVVTPLAVAPEVIIIEEEEDLVEMVLKQDALEELEIITPLRSCMWRNATTMRRC
jgi:hypothetical protein